MDQGYQDWWFWGVPPTFETPNLNQRPKKGKTLASFLSHNLFVLPPEPDINRCYPNELGYTMHLARVSPNRNKFSEMTC